MKSSNVILRIGSTDPFVHGRTLKQTSIEAPDGKGGVFTLTDNWNIVSRNAYEDIKKYAAVRPMRVQLSRKKPILEIRRGDLAEEVIDKVIEHLKRCSHYIFDLNNENQYDVVTKSAKGKWANMQWWFEDVRATKQVNVSIRKQTLAIGNLVESEMGGNESKLRDALYHIGHQPEQGMTVTELEDLLLEKVMEEHSEERSIFIKTYLNKNIAEEEREVRVYVKKGVQYGIISVSADKNQNPAKEGVYKIGTDRIGIGEDDAVSGLRHNKKLLEFLISQVAAKSEFQEDKKAGDEIVKKAVGKEEAITQEILWETLKEQMKVNLGVKNAGVVLKNCDSVEEGIKKYNEKAKKEGLDSVLTLKELTAKAKGTDTVSA